MSNMTIAAIAAEARKYFTLMTRTDGSTFWLSEARSDAGPLWVYELTRDAHGDMMPDDHKYKFIVESLDMIVENECEGADDARDLEVESDSYTFDLLKWLASRNDRLAYCDEWITEMGPVNASKNNSNPTETLISGGQYLERNEVLHSVVGSLAAELERRGDEEAPAPVCANCSREFVGIVHVGDYGSYCSLECMDAGETEGAK